MQKVQRYWRRLATGMLLASAAMAAYGVSTRLLRDSLVHALGVVSKPENELVTTYSFLFCVLFWMLFSGLILASVYVAVLDMRYVRLQFMLEKRELMKETWENEEFRKMLSDRQRDEK
jgi:hypothetical protein